MRQRFEKDRAATLVFRPSRNGPPLAPSLTILEDNGEALPGTAPTPLAPAVNTAINFPGGYQEGVRTLALLSDSDIEAGETYAIGEGAADSWENVRVEEVHANGVVLVESTRLAHEDGEEFRGLDLTAPLSAANLAKLGRYQATWTYTIHGVSYRDHQLFEVVQRVFRIPVTPADLRVRIPKSLLESASKRALSQEELIRISEARIIRVLQRDKFDPDRIRDPDQFHELGIIGVRWLLLEQQADLDDSDETGGSRTKLSRVKQEWRQEYSDLADAGITWYDSDDNLRSEDDEEARTIPRYLKKG